MAEKKRDNTRSNITFAFVIILGLVIGVFIRRMHIGLLIGLVLGLIGSWLMRKK